MGRFGHEEWRGRDEEVMPVLFEEMASGLSVKEACIKHGWPRSTVGLWSYSPKWKAHYQVAQEVLGQIQAERVLEMAEKAAESRNMAEIQGIRILVDSLKWAASKNDWRRYGDKVDVTSGGEKMGGVIALPPEQEPVKVLSKAREVLQAGETEARALPASTSEEAR